MSSFIKTGLSTNISIFVAYCLLLGPGNVFMRFTEFSKCTDPFSNRSEHSNPMAMFFFSFFVFKNVLFRSILNGNTALACCDNEHCSTARVVLLGFVGFCQ